MCKKLILEYINKNGILENYHSFNYVIDDGKLKLNKDIIISYQEMNINNYKYLIKDN